MYSRPEYLEAMVATYKVRAVPINVNYRYVAEELAYLFDNAELRALVVEASFAPVVASILGRLPRLRARDRRRGRIARRRGTARRRSTTRRFSPPTPRRPASDPDPPMTSTSPTPAGPPGNPKGVVWRHEDIFFATMTPGVVVDTARGRRPTTRSLPSTRDWRPWPRGRHGARTSSSPTPSDRSCT